MTEPISWEQERKIVWGYLDGMTDDEIMKFAEVGSKATVSKYVNKSKEFRKDHTEEEALEEWDLVEEFEDLRGLSLLLKKKKLTLEDASAGLRVVTKARSLKLHEDQVNGFIDDYSSYVRKNDLNPEEFFESARELTDLGKKWGIRPKDVVIRAEQLKVDMATLEQRKKSFESQTATAKGELHRRLEMNKVKLEELDEFEADNEALEKRGLHPSDRKKLFNAVSNLAESGDTDSLLRVAESVRSLRSETGKLQIRKGRLEVTINQLGEREGALRGTIKQAETTISSLKGEEEELQRRIGKLQAENAEFVPLVRGAAEGVNSLEGSLRRDTALMVLEVEPENLTLHDATHFMERMGKWARAYGVKDAEFFPYTIGMDDIAKFLADRESQETMKEAVAEAIKTMYQPTRTTEPLTGGDFSAALSKGMAILDGSIILRRAHEQPALVEENSNLKEGLAETEKAAGESAGRHRQEIEALNGRIKKAEEALGKLEVVVGDRDQLVGRQKTEIEGLKQDLARRNQEVLQSTEFQAQVEERATKIYDEWNKNQRPTEVRNEAVSLLVLTAQAIDKGQPCPEHVPPQVYSTMKEQITRGAEDKKEKDFWNEIEKKSDEKAEVKFQKKVKDEWEPWYNAKVLPWIQEISGNVRALSVELLKGEYSFACGKCGTPQNVKLDGKQIALLQSGGYVNIQCINPSCTDDFPLGPLRHSIPFDYSTIISLRLPSLTVS